MATATSRAPLSLRPLLSGGGARSSRSCVRQMVPLRLLPISSVMTRSSTLRRPCLSNFRARREVIGGQRQRDVVVGPTQLKDVLDHAEYEVDGSRRDFEVVFPSPAAA
jgi:hypothetical protein